MTATEEIGLLRPFVTFRGIPLTGRPGSAPRSEHVDRAARDPIQAQNGAPPVAWEFSSTVSSLITYSSL
jgi:hypothetical protein